MMDMVEAVGTPLPPGVGGGHLKKHLQFSALPGCSALAGLSAARIRCPSTRFRPRVDGFWPRTADGDYALVGDGGPLTPVTGGSPLNPGNSNPFAADALPKDEGIQRCASPLDVPPPMRPEVCLRHGTRPSHRPFHTFDHAVTLPQSERA